MIHILLLGAGHSNLELLRAAAKKPFAARLTLVTASARATYSGMVPGVLAGLYNIQQASICLDSLCGAAGANLLIGEASGLDLPNCEALLRSGARVGFDGLVIDTGSEARGKPAGAIAVRPFETFLGRLAALTPGLRITIAGGGAGGVEIAFALATRFRISLLSEHANILPGFPREFRARCGRALSGAGVTVFTSTRVIGFERGQVLTDGNGGLPGDALIWATGPAAPASLSGTAFARDPRGFISVTDSLQVIGHKNIFAAGDAASLAGLCVPKSGLYAIREGQHLARNLRRFLRGAPLGRFRPQKHALSLLSMGDRRAIGTRNGLTFEGRLVWRLKDFIDRSYVRSFARLG